ncbi:MAG TPA: hypothetical protein VFV68_03095 [Agriterribacter sp.]|nr:hypothetical protein [Agriterribacter sp.]
MSNIDEHIRRVNEKIQLLLKQYHTLQKENDKLKIELEQKRTNEKNTQEKVALLQQQVEIAKMSSGEAGKEIKTELEKRINTYIREIDQCIALLANQ